MKYFIGEYYRYPESDVNSNNVYKLTDYFKKQGIFLFECGHWCTDNVFEDLIRCKTGIQVYKDLQLELLLTA